MKTPLKNTISFLGKENERNELDFNTWKANRLIFLFAYLILFLLKPYSLDTLSIGQQMIHITIYSLIYCIAYSLSAIIFMPFNISVKWTKFKELCAAIVFIMIAWLLILGFMLYDDTIFFTVDRAQVIEVIAQKCLVCVLFSTMGLGSLILVMLFFVGEYNLGKRKIPGENMEVNTEKISIRGKNKNEQLELCNDTFILAKSEGHYVKIYYYNAFRQTRHYLMRNSLKELEKLTRQSSNICKCHKSYLINMDCVKSVIENPNRPYIYLRDFKGKIPVSKEKVQEIKEYRKNHISVF
ncbi:hypothetical protein GWK08_06300 [Leptobacterium flavescens]|uniref:HTH LytTR-type domain-containing protein n=1 Tax=Leptobacterium flavescens TaxID=472055 RepID=A0A6P0UKG3_9FLAO|nr:LytTR family DNA-binding domain-containing protein [Leptobacterium flavescens]NER13042.1 hypothetical protein [Leptobacterium flavescens]